MHSLRALLPSGHPEWRQEVIFDPTSEGCFGVSQVKEIGGEGGRWSRQGVRPCEGLSGSGVLMQCDLSTKHTGYSGGRLWAP